MAAANYTTPQKATQKPRYSPLVLSPAPAPAPLNKKAVVVTHHNNKPKVGLSRKGSTASRCLLWSSPFQQSIDTRFKIWIDVYKPSLVTANTLEEDPIEVVVVSQMDVKQQHPQSTLPKSPPLHGWIAGEELELSEWQWQTLTLLDLWKLTTATAGLTNATTFRHASVQLSQKSPPLQYSCELYHSQLLCRLFASHIHSLSFVY